MRKLLFTFLSLAIGVANAQVDLDNGLFLHLNFNGESIVDQSVSQAPITEHGVAAKFEDGDDLTSALYVMDASTAVQATLEGTVYAASFWAKTDVPVDNGDSKWFAPIQFYEYGTKTVPNTGGIWLGPSTSLGSGEEVLVGVTDNAQGYYPRTMAGSLGLDDDWHHYLINYNGSSYDIYVDGAKQTTFTGSSIGHTPLMEVKDPVIGLRYHSDGEIRTNNTGRIDEVRFYNRSLNEEEITELATSYFNELEMGLITYLDFNDNVIVDKSPLENTVNIIGTAEQFGTGNELSTALKVDGTSATQVEVTDKVYATSFWAATDIPVDNNDSKWFSPIQFYEYGTKTEPNTGGIWLGPSTTLGVDEEVLVGVTYNAQGYYPRTMAGNLGLDIQWHHYLINYNGSTYDIYVDGEKQSTYRGNAASHTPLMDVDNPVIGVRYHSDGEIRTSNTGMIDEVRIYNRALGLDEIDYLYRSGEFSIITSVDEYLTATKAIVYPTLIGEQTVFNSSEEIKQVSVYNLSGIEVANETSLQDLESELLPKGILVMKLVLEDGQTVTQKVVKQ